MKCVILILTTNNDPFKYIENEGQRPTWIKQFSLDKNIKTYYYKSKSSIGSTISINDNILCPGQETKANIGIKTLQAFEFIRDKYQPDFIYRTNISSYINHKIFTKHINEIPMNKFYGGFIGYHPMHGRTSQVFCSGSGYFISKDLIDLCIDKKNNWNHALPDDVAISKILCDNKISPTHQNRFMFPPDHEIIPNKIPKNIFHYRCKFPKNRRVDTQRMHYLHKHLGYSNDIN